jgi:hypothetical protein
MASGAGGGGLVAGRAEEKQKENDEYENGKSRYDEARW